MQHATLKQVCYRSSRMALELEETVSSQEASNICYDAFDYANEYINEEESKIDDQFKTDYTVPAGWNFKGVLASGKHFHLKCPKGTIYRSRADAFGKMYSSGKYSKKETELLKDCLKYEGWEDNDTIPNGWKIKRGKDNSISLLEQGGKKFLSAVKAYEFVKKHHKYYSKEDFSKLRILAKVPRCTEEPRKKRTRHLPKPVSRRTRRLLKPVSSWSTDESLYPIGWKYTDVLDVVLDIVTDVLGDGPGPRDDGTEWRDLTLNMIFVDLRKCIEAGSILVSRIHVFELVVANHPSLMRPVEHGGDLLLGLLQGRLVHLLVIRGLGPVIKLQCGG